MAPRKHELQCQVCKSSASKYTCARCSLVYCSVPCYKQHNDSCSEKSQHRRSPEGTIPQDEHIIQAETDALVQDAGPSLRSLSSIKWPYVPDESAYPDPLKRDDPKPLRLPQYEAIAMSLEIRRILGSNPQLRENLISIDKLRGENREIALEKALGVGISRNNPLATLGTTSEEEQKSLRQLAEAIESAVRGGRHDILGLDWGD